MRYVRADVPRDHPEHGRVYAVSAHGRTWVGARSGWDHLDWLAAHGLGPARNPQTGRYDVQTWPLANVESFPYLGQSG